MSWFSRGRHRANIHSRSVWDLETELEREEHAARLARQDAFLAEMQEATPWPVVMHEGRPYYQLDCTWAVTPGAGADEPLEVVLIPPSTSVGVIGIVIDTPTEEVPPWSKRT